MFYYYNIFNAGTTIQTVYFSNQSYAWSTSNGWNYDGSLSVTSQSMWYSITNWNVVGSAVYGQNAFAVVAGETNFENSINNNDLSENEFYLISNGRYGGNNWFNW
jgi:hypothetical protein